MRSFYLLLLVSIFIHSCVSKKYGCHFRNDIRGSSSGFQKQIAEYEPELIASRDLDKVSFISEIDPVSKKHSSIFKSVPDDSQEIFIPKTKLFQRTKSSQGRVEGKKKGRKLEPIGMGSTVLFVISALIGLSMGFTPLLFVLMGISMVGAAISINRTRQNKKRWKGSFFGHFVIVTGILLLVLLGLSVFIQSVFGNM